MSIKIEVQSTAIDIVQGVSQKTNKPYKLNIQTAYFHDPEEAYPVKMKILLDEGQPPYNKGEYTLDPKSFYVDRNGSLALSIKLAPLVGDIKKAS